MAAQSSRELCEQMGGVCRQMRQAAEDAGKRSAEAEEAASFFSGSEGGGVHFVACLNRLAFLWQRIPFGT